MIELDQDALDAALDLVGRSGATQCEIGYVHEDVPAEQAGWYAQATYRGAKLIAEDHRGPAEAADALARRLLQGAKCVHCHGLITMSDEGGVIYPRATLTDGSRWDAETALAAPKCRYRRMADRWVRGCESTHPRQSAAGPNREQRRAKRRKR